MRVLIPLQRSLLASSPTSHTRTWSCSVCAARSITQQPSTRYLKRWMPGCRPCSKGDTRRQRGGAERISRSDAREQQQQCACCTQRCTGSTRGPLHGPHIHQPPIHPHPPTKHHQAPTQQLQQKHPGLSPRSAACSACAPTLAHKPSTRIKACTLPALTQICSLQRLRSTSKTMGARCSQPPTAHLIGVCVCAIQFLSEAAT